MRIYIAGPLFNEMELERNRKVRDMLLSTGFETYLPQEDGGISYNEIARGGMIAETRKKIFDNDIDEIKKCDIMVCLLDGRVPDEGMCIELGYAHALGKPCCGYITDQRSLDQYGPSLMIDGCLKATARTIEELKVLLSQELN